MTDPHAFRHTSASTMIANGADIVTTPNELGHANATTTANISATKLQWPRPEQQKCGEVCSSIVTRKPEDGVEQVERFYQNHNQSRQTSRNKITQYFSPEDTNQPGTQRKISQKVRFFRQQNSQKSALSPNCPHGHNYGKPI